MTHTRCSAESCPSLVLPPQDLLGALAMLEPLELSPETRAHWAQLAEAALDQEALAVAERCYTAMGDVAKARYLHKVRGARCAQG
jgi:intraflagellar transport protein 172